MPLQEPIWFEYYGPIRQAEAASAVNATIEHHLRDTSNTPRIPIRRVTAPHLKVPAALNKIPIVNVTETTLTISFSASSSGTITLQTDSSSQSKSYESGLDQEQIFQKPTEEKWIIKFDFNGENGVTCRIVTLNAHTPSDPIITDEKIVVDGTIKTINKVYRQEEGGDDSGFNDGKCLICCSEDSTVVAFPCRHCCMCHECAERFSTMTTHCPVCRATVTELIDCIPEEETHSN